MNQFASQADLANESIAGMAAQSATLIEAGEEQGKAGRALKQIYARLGADTSGAATEIEKLGVATIDSNGDMRALTQIVNELAPEYAKLNGEQKTNLAKNSVQRVVDSARDQSVNLNNALNTLIKEMQMSNRLSRNLITAVENT